MITKKRDGTLYIANKKIKKKKVLLIGDTIIDKYVYTNTLGKPGKKVYYQF